MTIVVNRSQLPSTWRVTKLGEVCEINPRRPALDRTDDAPTTFVPMAAVNESSGTIANALCRPFSEVRRGYTWFSEGDVLFAKITPCMQNGKHAVARNLIDGIGFGTTEFHVIRPSHEVTADWVHHFVRRPELLRDASSHFSGAVGQQRLSENYLKDSEIPLPPVAEQKRITAMLNEQMAMLNGVRKAQDECLVLATALSTSYLQSIFPVELGNTMSMPSSWRRIPLGDASEVVSGVTVGRQLREPTSRRVPYLRVANVKDGYLDLSEIKQIDVTEAEFQKWRLLDGDILLTEGGDLDKLGRGTFWSGQIPDCIHQNHIFRVRFDSSEVYPPFAAAQLGSPYGKKYFLRHAKKTTGIASINQKVLRGFPLILPPINEQLRIAKTLQAQQAAAAAMAAEMRNESDALARLPAALLRRAFSGDA